MSAFDLLYSVHAKKNSIINKKESAVLNEPAVTENPIRITDSTISISNLLEYVNKNFPDVLPESVLRHFGYERRPEGKIGESALYSDRFDTDYLSAVERGDMKTAQQMVDNLRN